MPRKRLLATRIHLAAMVVTIGLSMSGATAAEGDPATLPELSDEDFRQAILTAREVCTGGEAAPQDLIAACTVAIENADASFAIGLEPLDEDKLAAALVRRGNAFLALDETDGLRPAVDDFTRAVSVAPENPVGYRAHSRLLWKSTNPPVINIALVDLAALLELEPDNTDALRDLALAQAKLGEYELALEHIEIALARGVEANRLIARGAIRLAAGVDGAHADFEDALADFEEALVLDPDNAEAYVGRALAYGAEAHAHLMVADLSKAIALSPSVAEYRLWRAAGHIYDFHLDEAMSDLYDTLARARFDGSDGETAILAYVWRAMTFSWLDLDDESTADCRRARYLYDDQPAGICSDDDKVDELKDNGDYYFGNIHRIARAMIFHIAGVH